MKTNKTFQKRIFLRYVSCAIVIHIMFISSTGIGDAIDDYRITVTSRVDNDGYSMDSTLYPISEDIINDISKLDHVEEIVPVVKKSYGMDFQERPPGSFTDEPPGGDKPFDGEPPNWDSPFDGGAPPDWNGTFPNRDFDGRMNDMFDYIIEGVSLDSLSSYEFYSLPDDLVSGRSLEEDDLGVVYIGEDAQDYFNVSVNEQISIEESSFTVIGIFSDADYNKYVYMNLADARSLLQIQESEVNTLYVYVDDNDFLEPVCSSIQEEYSYLMTQYEGKSNQFSPPDNMNQPSNSIESETSSPTPGFEGIVLFGVISIFIAWKKMKQRDVSNNEKS